MRPIAFMRLRQLDKPEDILRKYSPKALAVEQKYDGFKVMATRGRGGTKLYSRNGKDLTAKAPSIVNRLDKILPPNTTVLGEMVYIVGGQQELGQVQSILHSASAARAVRQEKELGGRLEFIIYDCLEFKGMPLADAPWRSRRARVIQMISAEARGIVRRSKTYTWAKRRTAMKESLAAGGEGIVVKVKESPYIYRKTGSSEPHGQWWKHKVPGEKAHTEDVILLGYAKREKRLAFKMYQIDGSGKRVFVGYVSNLPRITERSVQKMSDRKKAVVAEISHQERFPSGKFRHPGWIRLRPDKPLKSATMTRPKRGKMAKVKRNPKGSVTIDRTASGELQYAIDNHLGRGRGRKSNPRNSKVKDALNAEATRFKKFEDFARAYWDACARGLYWVATDEKRFYIGQHERRQIETGKFNVSCSPELALSGKNEGKKYVAELDVTRVPGHSIQIKRGTSGAQIKVTGAPGSVKVTRVLEADKALRAFKWQLSILPSSKEELRKIWERAWKKRKEEDARRALRRKKEEEREAKRAKTKREKDEAAAARLARKKEREAERIKAARTAAGRRARKAAEAKKPSKKKASKKKGSWKRVARAPNPSSPPREVARKIPSHINNPGC